MAMEREHTITGADWRRALRAARARRAGAAGRIRDAIRKQQEGRRQ